MPRLLEVMVRTGIREVLVLGALFACLGFALLTERLEFSLALGAFIAGIIISESHYSPQIEAEIVPFRDVFNSLFFISIGMLLDLGYALAHPWQVLGIAAAVLALKAVATGAAVALLGYAWRIVVLVAAALAQVGEFSFVLLRVGQEHGLVDPGVYQTFIAASILTMVATPVLIALAPRWAAWGRERGAATAGEGLTPAGPSGHVVVVGYGLSGRNLARVLRAAGIPFVVLELAAEGLRRARAAGDPVLFGDATRRDILERAGVARASVVVFAISDLLAVLRAVTLARQLSPAVHIIVRTRMVSEIDALHRAGADEVIAEEFETSIEIFTRVLARYHVPANVIRAETRALRGERYAMLRSPSGAGDVSQAVLELLGGGDDRPLPGDGDERGGGEVAPRPRPAAAERRDGDRRGARRAVADQPARRGGAGAGGRPGAGGEPRRGGERLRRPGARGGGGGAYFLSFSIFLSRSASIRRRSRTYSSSASCRLSGSQTVLRRFWCRISSSASLASACRRASPIRARTSSDSASSRGRSIPWLSIRSSASS